MAGCPRRCETTTKQLGPDEICIRMDVGGDMTTAPGIQVVNVSGFKVRGNQVGATFDLVVAPLNWSEAQAHSFEDALKESYPDLNPYRQTFEQVDTDGPVIAPTTVERLSIRWIGDLQGPVPREKVEAEFASRRQSVLSLLVDHVGKTNVE